MDEPKRASTIAQVCKVIAGSRQAYDTAFRSLTASSTIYAVQKVLAERAALERASISSATAALREASKLDTISSTVRVLSEANASIKAAFEATHGISAAMRVAVQQQEQWRAIAKTLTISDQVAELSLRRHTSEMFSASLAAQSQIAKLQNAHLGAAIKASESLSQSLRVGLDDVSQSYRALVDAIGSRPANVAAFAPVVSQRPPIELFREATLLQGITIAPEEIEPELDFDVTEAPEDRTLEGWLADIDPGLVNLLEGARQAISSDNPDRARHLATSVRELFTHVVRRLAPDDGVQGWTTNDEHFHDGRPTRRARLLYICRGINFDQLSTFVDADVRAALTLVDSLHAGTHGITCRLTEPQLRVLVQRMESLLLFLLRLENENR